MAWQRYFRFLFCLENKNQGLFSKMRHNAMYRLCVWGVRSPLEPFIKSENYDFQKCNSDNDGFPVNRTCSTGPLTCQHPPQP